MKHTEGETHRNWETEIGLCSGVELKRNIEELNLKLKHISIQSLDVTLCGSGWCLNNIEGCLNLDCVILTLSLSLFFWCDIVSIWSNWSYLNFSYASAYTQFRKSSRIMQLLSNWGKIVLSSVFENKNRLQSPILRSQDTETVVFALQACVDLREGLGWTTEDLS